MNITRHNYESYFLLYIDNELSAAEMNDVELFIQQNPDLKRELQLLQKTVLLPDSISFNKDSLLKEETINAEIQEKLLLLLDNELSEDDKQELTALIGTDKTISKEWELLQQLKLPETASIVFEDKQSLYRTERKRVIYFDWR